MTIRKRLFLNFGLILGILSVLFGLNLMSKIAATRATELATAVEKVRFQVMSNRVTLNGYLLSGAPIEVDTLHKGESLMSDLIRDAEAKAQTAEQKSQLVTLEGLERDWDSNFASKMIEKRKEVDAGNAKDSDDRHKKIIDRFSIKHPWRFHCWHRHRHTYSRYWC